jgi:SAM-dependent methyltransferase
MTDASPYWSVWAPYWSLIEDNYLDLESLDRLLPTIESPVLVVGAGQGLLVEHLRSKDLVCDGVDLDPLMIEYARKRRGLDLILASGADLPMADDSYGSAIIATGVLDLMDDESLISSILLEALRVTLHGAVLAAFYGLHPGTERIFRSSGLIDEQGRLHQKLVYRMATLDLLHLVGTMSRHARVGRLRALLMLARFPLHLNWREFRMSRSLARIFRQARRDLGSSDPLIDASIETVPFRNERDIRDLLSRLDLPVHALHAFGTCHVVQLSRPAPR